ncbi:type 1 glutamine amidotransferase family protein [Bacillus sp. FSL W7-1360]
MKEEVIVFISEGYADWEGAYICSELNKPNTKFVIKTAGITKEPIKSMGGFTVIPDYSIGELPPHFAMLILIGGTSWMTGQNDHIKSIIDTCVDKGILVSAICDACTFLANNGYLDHTAHTGNSLDYLAKFAPNYTGEKHFMARQVVSTDSFITANGTAAIEFSREILKYLGVMQEKELDEWYHWFKVGFYEE